MLYEIAQLGRIGVGPLDQVETDAPSIDGQTTPRGHIQCDGTRRVGYLIP